MKPIITFKGYRINKLNYNRIEKSDIDEDSKEEKGNLKRNISIGLTDDKKDAVVILNVTLKDIASLRSIECELIGEFLINDDLKKDKIEDALAVNGVAMVYPYVRSIISIVSTLDSDNALVIPTINTSVFDEQD